MKNRNTVALFLELLNRVEENKSTGSLWTSEQVIEHFIKDYEVSIEAFELPHCFPTVVKPY